MDTAPSQEDSNYYFYTNLGKILNGDSLEIIKNEFPEKSIDLIVTSPPYALLRKKEYGNIPSKEYLNWFRPFSKEFSRILKDSGSIVIDMGGAWNDGMPTKSLYQYELLIMLCREFNFQLAQDFFWWNPSKLPSPAEWVTKRRIRVKDAVNCIWWLSKTSWPKSYNQRVSLPYSESMEKLILKGSKKKERPSGHVISTHFAKDNGSSIPPNLIAVPNSESNSIYLNFCRENNIKPHPARFPSVIPEYFIRMLTDEHDVVLDPFAGSCVTGEISEKLNRKWICIEKVENYLKGALGRFKFEKHRKNLNRSYKQKKFYKISHPSNMWNCDN